MHPAVPYKPIAAVIAAVAALAAAPAAFAQSTPQIYWTSFRTGTIGAANLDGTRVNQNYLDTRAPEEIAVDGQHIYWANSGSNTIGEANLDGTDVNQSFITGADSPAGVAVSVPIATVSPSTPPSFPTTPQGKLSAPVTVTVGNSGQRDLSITGLSFTGTHPGDFLVTSDSCLGHRGPR